MQVPAHQQNWRVVREAKAALHVKQGAIARQLARRSPRGLTGASRRGPWPSPRRGRGKNPATAPFTAAAR